MIGFWFSSGAGIIPEFFIYTPPPELSKIVISISSLLSFFKIGHILTRLILKKVIN